MWPTRGYAPNADGDTMLDWVHIQNFRCLRDVRLELGPFTVLVGPNASGKTAVADALTLRSVKPHLDNWRRGEERMAIEAGRREGEPIRSRGPIGDLANAQKYAFDLRLLRAESTADESHRLPPNGQGLANVFDSLTRAEQDAFVATFTRLVPMYGDIKAQARQGRNHLQFKDRWESGLWYEADHVSDGTMLCTALVALTFQSASPDLVVIEDIDHGLHPYLQGEVVSMLRQLSEGAIGPKPVQVVATTHSKSLLDHLAPHEVRFIARDHETGEAHVRSAPTDRSDWTAVYEEFQESLGDLWMTGALGGVPAL